MGEMEQICFQIISCSGTAKSMYVEAIQKLMQNDSIREEKAKAGMAYVKNIHNIADFTTNLRKIIIDTVKED